MTKQIMGMIMIFIGIALGLYVGLWTCFIGGIVEIADVVRGISVASSLSIAWSVTKIFLAGFFGQISAMMLVFPGLSLMGRESKTKRKRG